VQAETGLTAIVQDHFGEALSEPRGDACSHADVYTGLQGVIAVLAALQHRNRTGEGQHVDVCLFDTVIASLENNGFKFRYIDPPWIEEILGNVIVAREETIEKKPDLVVKVARGIAESSVFGLANPDGALRNHWKMYPETKPQEVNDETFRQARRIFDSRFDLTKLEPGVKWGENMPAQWKRMADISIEEGLVPKNFDISACYTNQFIPQINEFDQKKIEADAKGSNW